MIVSISHSSEGYKNIKHLFGDFKNDVWSKFRMGDVIFLYHIRVNIGKEIVKFICYFILTTKIIIIITIIIIIIIIIIINIIFKMA